MNFDFVGKYQHIPAERIKSSREKQIHILNPRLTTYKDQNNVVVGDHKFKPGTNRSETVNQDAIQ